MYSVVLLMALSGSADTPSLGWGCKGCCGYDCSGCCGCNGCSGCCGYSSCHGCCGGGHKMFGGHKCCGGCCGYDCSGCCGCCGGHHKGCCGGGFKMFGGHKCCGGCHGCSGCCGGCCGGSYGGEIHGGTVVVPHSSVTMPKADAVAEVSAPATIVVSLPAAAKLSIDGNATTSSTERRTFVSPALEAGQEYYYTLKAEINGQVKEERVTVKAGQEVNIKIEFPTASVASK